jgi:bacterioferritin
MQGDPEIIELLNEILTAELTAINQYFIHSRMCANWGLTELAEHSHNESINEMKDADSIIERILFLDGVPNMQRLNPVRVGETVPEQLELDRQLEVAAVERYNRGIALAVDKGDNGSRELLARNLIGEEEHLDWIEAQQHLISVMGLENYLAQQIDAGED